MPGSLNIALYRIAQEALTNALRHGSGSTVEIDLGYRLKSLAPEELVSAMRVAARGDALIDPSVTRRLISAFATSIRPVAAEPAELERLTSRECEVLLLVANASSNAEIAAHLHVGEETVKTHVSRILAKLGLRDRVHAVVYAYRNGLVGDR